MITLDDLLMKKYKFASQPKSTQDNLMILLERLNKLESAYGKSLILNSGLRTPEDQIRIYNQKGIVDPKRIPMGSSHLIGAAADIADPKKELQIWSKNNEQVLESIGLWCEDFGSTPTWVHYQINPPKSGKRFFIP